MRLMFALLLSMLVSLNAAYAGVTGLCDALEHMPAGSLEHGQHPGHHDHRDDHAAGGSDPSNPEPASDGSQARVSADHCHGHATFTPLPPSCIGLPVQAVHSRLAALPPVFWKSVVPGFPKRPPRAFLA